MLPIIVEAQVTSGRNFINLAVNGKAIQYQTNGKAVLQQACPNTSCQNQIWDILPVSGMPGVYTIKQVQSGKYLTFTEVGEAAYQIAPEVRLEPLKPITQGRRKQYFYITSDKEAYVIMPKRATEALDNENVCLAADLNNLNLNGSSLSYEYKNRTHNPETYRNLANVMWNLIPIPIGTISRTTTSTPVVADRSQRSPSVIVTPPSANKLEVDIKTGTDNLEPRGFQTNPQITLNLRNRNPIVLEDINKNQTWPNNSIKRVSIPLPHDINLQDLQSITISRTVVSNWNNIDAGIADNWNIERITATASIKTNGRLERTILFNKSGTGAQPLVRIIYEKRNSNTNPIEQTTMTFELSENSTSVPASPTPRTSVANPIIKIETLTGGDDLRGGNDNLNVMIRLKIRPVRNISLNNINAGRKWPNFSETTITKTITAAPFTFDDIEDVILRHTGGLYGAGIDNWYLDKLKITLTIAGDTRVLIDQVGAPIHYFKGDARSKTFQIIK